MPKPITPDPNPTPWNNKGPDGKLLRDPEVRNVQCVPTIELKGPKGELVTVNVSDQGEWLRRGYKASGRAALQNTVGPNSLGQRALEEPAAAS